MKQSQFYLPEMTWQEIEQAKRLAPLAIIPTGSCEQHGPHMTLETDSVRALEFSKRVAERLAPRILIAPCLTIAVSEHHMAFSGTITLDPVTFQQVLFEVGASLYRHGWRKIFILNGHGGNTPAIGVAVARLQAEFPDLGLAHSGITPIVPDLARKLATSPRTGHSCEIETSQALYLDARLVRQDKLAAGEFRKSEDLPQTNANSVGRIHAPLPFHQITANGALGDARAASFEIGEQLIQEALNRVCCFLEAFVQESPDSPANTGRTPGTREG